MHKSTKTVQGIPYRTLSDILRWRAENQAKRIAYTYLIDGENQELHLTYAELDEKARSLAALLQIMGMKGQRALLLFPAGLEFISAFFACLYAGVIAVPAYPPRLHRSMERINIIAEDSEPGVIITVASLLPRIKTMFASNGRLNSIPILNIEDTPQELVQKWQRLEFDVDSLAFLQFTSGTTGIPKGVKVTHENILSNESIIYENFKHQEDSVIIGWLPFYHDMGLIGNILQPLYGGMRCVLMSPIAFLQKPIRWLQAITKYKGTTSGGNSLAYDLCVNKTDAEQQTGLNLSTWTLAFIGADSIQSSTLERFAAIFKPFGFQRHAFYPCYGLAEATLFVTGGPKNHLFQSISAEPAELQKDRIVKSSNTNEALEFITCGQISSYQKVKIIDPATSHECPENKIGEIWISGPCVAKGYWKCDEDSNRSFHNYISVTGEGPFFGTGDLGFMDRGHLYVTGRIRDIITIKGLRYYPHFIEKSIARAHPAINESACSVFSLKSSTVEQLGVVAELKRNWIPESCSLNSEDLYSKTGNSKQVNYQELTNVIQQVILEEHKLESHVVALFKLGGIPRTSSGKIRRHACHDLIIQGSAEALWLWEKE